MPDIPARNLESEIHSCSPLHTGCMETGIIPVGKTFLRPGQLPEFPGAPIFGALRAGIPSFLLTPVTGVGQNFPEMRIRVYCQENVDLFYFHKSQF
jgi:hypothetical protein